MTVNAARLRLLLGAFCISFSAVFVKLVSVPPTSSAFYRVFIGGLALSAWLLLRRRREPLRRNAVVLLVIAAVFFVGDLWFWHRSIVLVGPGLSTLLASLQVFFVTIFGVLLLGQSATLRQVLAIPLALVGLTLIVGVDWQALPADYRAGVIYGVLTAVCYAGYLLTLRRAQQISLRRVPAPELAVISLLTAAMLFGTAHVEGVSLAVTSGSDLFWLLCLGLLAHVGGWLLIASGLPHVTPAMFGVALLFQPWLSFVWDIVLFDRGITPLEGLGAALTLAAIYIGTTAGRRPAEASPQGG